mmetsp:Transcript_60454/g.124347  ORF Transcript_60454/g.124347 Transcript_60454/m.124347 type:complete len:204 (+) Transcript_60454:1236-1847(+)
MKADVRRRLKRMDPPAELCEGEGTASCLRNRGAEIECENGVCSNRVVQRGLRVPTEAHWYDGKGWGLRLLKDVDKDEIVERYVGEVLEPDEFWSRFKNMSGEEPMYFCEFVLGYIIDAGAKGSFARLINHSCEPSAVFRHRTVLGTRQVVVTMLRAAVKLVGAAGGRDGSGVQAGGVFVAGVCFKGRSGVRVLLQVSRGAIQA